MKSSSGRPSSRPPRRALATPRVAAPGAGLDIVIGWVSKLVRPQWLGAYRFLWALGGGRWLRRWEEVKELVPLVLVVLLEMLAAAAVEA